MLKRKRKNPADNILPKRVYRGKSKYEYHPATGGSISICCLSSPVSVVWKEYNKIVEKIEKNST
ncbi:hypothetical protein [Xenorhabdus eapokensis]|uniref:hypothetical protein n=1 Tax=Xenorhabdus eapokensis TaxID=1873482 RepID=UPI00130134B7|nr:hypothetical protein [Xenorhabdus eapokensis]